MEDPDSFPSQRDPIEAEALIGLSGEAIIAVARRLVPAPSACEVRLSASADTPVILAVGREQLVFPDMDANADRALLDALATKRTALIVEAPPGEAQRFTRVVLRFPGEPDA